MRRLGQIIPPTRPEALGSWMFPVHDLSMGALTPDADV